MLELLLSAAVVTCVSILAGYVIVRDAYNHPLT